MKIIGIAAKKNCDRYEKVFRSVYKYLIKKGKEVYIQKHIADLIGLKDYKEFRIGQKHVDLILCMGGDGTILSVVKRLKNFNTKLFGINMGTLGFMSEIPPVQINKTLERIFLGDFTLDKRSMLDIEVKRGDKTIHRSHALNEVVISQGELARLIQLRTKVDNRKLTNYHADGLIVATPTGSTAYSLSAGGPIVHPSINAFILTPIAPHSFTQKPIVIPDHKVISIRLKSEHKRVNLTSDGQRLFCMEYYDKVYIRKGKTITFVRLPNESFFETLRQKLDWGKKLEK